MRSDQDDDHIKENETVYFKTSTDSNSDLELKLMCDISAISENHLLGNTSESFPQQSVSNNMLKVIYTNIDSYCKKGRN